MYPFKFSTLVAILAIFLIGEVTVVTFGPYSPARRKHMVQDLPVIKQIRSYQYRNEMRQAFSELPGGALHWSFGNMSQSWTDIDALLEEAEKGSWQAGAALNKLRRNTELRRDYDHLKEAAQEGDLFSMIEYYQSAIWLNEAADSSKAAAMLLAHPSASARAAVTFRNPDFKWDTKEGMLLQAQVARESVRHPKASDSSYRSTVKYNIELLHKLRMNAAEGDADSQWVIEQLATTPVWREPAIH